MACLELAERSAVGRGLTRSDADAASYYDKACEAGDGEGCWEAGYRYEKGRGVPKDKKRALARYQQACARGREGGCYRAKLLR